MFFYHFFFFLGRQQCVIVERLDSHNVMTIGINRPEKRNCVNIKTAGLLVSAFEEFEKDDAIHCAVLHGFGGFFCGGYDLEELSQTPKDDRQQKISSVIFGDGPMVNKSVLLIFQYGFSNL